MEKKYCTAIVLAAGQGRRMGTEVHKQYLLLGGRPVLYYSLHTFEASPLIDEIILVTGEGEEQYCKEEIVEEQNGIILCGMDFAGCKKTGMYSCMTGRALL